MEPRIPHVGKQHEAREGCVTTLVQRKHARPVYSQNKIQTLNVANSGTIHSPTAVVVPPRACTKNTFPTTSRDSKFCVGSFCFPPPLTTEGGHRVRASTPGAEEDADNPAKTASSGTACALRLEAFWGRIFQNRKRQYIFEGRREERGPPPNAVEYVCVSFPRQIIGDKILLCAQVCLRALRVRAGKLQRSRACVVCGMYYG